MSEVYELRKSDQAIASNEGIFGYLNPWATKVFNIFLIAVALLHRKYLFVLFFVAIQILLFGFSGHKAVLFSLILLAGLYLIDKVRYHSTIIIYGAIGMIVAALLYYYFLEELMLPSILVRRAFFVPSDLNYVYFDYFSSHDYIYWSNSILKNIFTYPYEVSPVFVIGDYLGFPEMAANTGIFGSGYMHFGTIGIIFYLLVAAISINLVQQFNKLPYWIVNAAVLMPFLTLFISSDLPTTLLTHGLFVAMLLLYLYSSSDPKTKVVTQ